MNKLQMICEHLQTNSTPGMVCDGNRRILSINKAFLEMCGYEENDLLGQTPGRLLQGAGSEADTKEIIRKKLLTAVPFDFSITNYCKDGRKFLAGVFVLPFVDGDNSADYFVGLGCELKQLEDSPVKTGPTMFRKAVANVLQLID